MCAIIGWKIADARAKCVALELGPNLGQTPPGGESSNEIKGKWWIRGKSNPYTPSLMYRDSVLAVSMPPTMKGQFSNVAFIGSI
jgi:hypothetical protein